VVSLLVALRWIYVRLQILAESAARQAQDVILDAHHLHEPKESAAALQDAEAQPLLHRDDSDGDYGTPPRER